jgi:CheY-like chemotaxis protein
MTPADGLRRLLVVCHDVGVLRVIREVLEEDGTYHVVTATDGALACAFLDHGEPPHAIVLDLLLPVVDGWTVLRRMREDARLQSTPVVVLSAAGGHAEPTVAAGVAVVTKPIDLSRLMEAIRSATSGS